MKRAQVRNTTCTDAIWRTSLTLVSALVGSSAVGSALADVPAPGCYARAYSDSHLAANPQQGVAALSLWVVDEGFGPTQPVSLRLAVRMAAQGQGARDGVTGQTLRQTAICAQDGRCYVECDGGSLTATHRGDDLVLATMGFALSGGDGCGGVSTLAETPGAETRYRLNAVAMSHCEAIWAPHSLPEPGCYGADLTGQNGVASSIRLSLREMDVPGAFTALEGELALRLSQHPRAQRAGLAGQSLSQYLWCNAEDGQCRSGPDEGALDVEAVGGDVVVTTSRYLVFSDGAQIDLADPSATAPARFHLSAHPAHECEAVK